MCSCRVRKGVSVSVGVGVAQGRGCTCSIVGVGVASCMGLFGRGRARGAGWELDFVTSHEGVRGALLVVDVVVHGVGERRVSKVTQVVGRSQPSSDIPIMSVTSRAEPG